MKEHHIRWRRPLPCTVCGNRVKVSIRRIGKRGKIRGCYSMTVLCERCGVIAFTRIVADSEPLQHAILWWNQLISALDGKW